MDHTKPSPVLPPEIISLILEDVDRKDQQSLAQCAHLFYHLAVPNIYRIVVLERVRDVHAFCKTITTNKITPIDEIDLGGLVLGLTVTALYSTEMGEGGKREKEEEMRFYHSAPFVLARALSHMHRLENFEFGGSFAPKSDELFDTLRSLPKLTFLSARMFHGYEFVYPETPQKRAMRGLVSRNFSEDFMSLARSKASSLCSLAISCDNSHFCPWNGSALFFPCGVNEAPQVFPVLRHLEFNGCSLLELQTDYNGEASPVDRLTLWMASHGTLEEISILNDPQTLIHQYSTIGISRASHQPKPSPFPGTFTRLCLQLKPLIYLLRTRSICLEYVETTPALSADETMDDWLSLFHLLKGNYEGSAIFDWTKKGGFVRQAALRPKWEHLQSRWTDILVNLCDFENLTIHLDTQDPTFPAMTGFAIELLAPLASMKSLKRLGIGSVPMHFAYSSHWRDAIVQMIPNLQTPDNIEIESIHNNLSLHELIG